MKIKVNPLFFAFVCVCILLGQGIDFALFTLALIAHEAGHIAMGRLRGYVMKSLLLMPYGAVMSTEERFDKTSGVVIGLAGPFANFVFAIIILGVWWLCPSVYGVTRPLVFFNLSLGLFNLLPVYPLDGARALLALCKNKLRCIKWLRAFGVALSFCLLALFIVSLFFKVNFSLGIMAVFLFYGAAFGTRDETYLSVLDAQSKNYGLGVEKRIVKISENVPLVRFFHKVGRTYETTFQIVDERGSVVATLDEEGLETLAKEHRLSSTYAMIIRGDEGRKKPQNEISKKYFRQSNPSKRLLRLVKRR